MKFLAMFVLSPLVFTALSLEFLGLSASVQGCLV